VIVDFHAHVFPDAVKADRTPYVAHDPVFRELYANDKARIATAEDLLRSMDRCGIDVSVMQGFGWLDGDLCREHNDALLDAAARHPDRLIAYCTVQPDAPGAREEAARCLAAPSPARGFGELRPDGQGYGGYWDALAPLWAVAGPAGAPLLVHASEPVGHRYAGKGRMTPGLLYTLALAYPEWPMVFAHLGGGLPFYAAMPDVRDALRNVYVDTAAWPLLYRPEVFPALAAVFDTGRILFASDYPLQAQDRSVARLRAVPLPGEVIDAMLGGNAARLLGLAGA